MKPKREEEVGSGRCGKQLDSSSAKAMAQHPRILIRSFLGLCQSIVSTEETNRLTPETATEGD
jgi:hypothetical protein